MPAAPLRAGKGVFMCVLGERVCVWGGPSRSVPLVDDTGAEISEVLWRTGPGPGEWDQVGGGGGKWGQERARWKQG